MTDTPVSLQKKPPGPPPAGPPRVYGPVPPPYFLKPTKTQRMYRRWKQPEPLRPAFVAAAAGAGAVGALTLGPMMLENSYGVGLPIVAATVAAVAAAAAQRAGRLVAPATPRRRGVRRANLTAAAFALLALALVGVAAVRDADWITVLALLLAMPVASYAATGGRSWVELIGGGVAYPFAALRMLPWAARGVSRAASSGRGVTWPVIRTGLIAAGLLLVFGALFAGADAAFGDLAAGLIPDISGGSTFVYTFAFVATMLAALAGVHLAQAPPPLHMLTPARPAPAGRWSWIVPIAALDLLFLAFCAVQARVFLAADKDALLAETGLTYAEYARQGFFQLVVVTVLVIAVIALAMTWAPSAARADRVSVRVLLGLLCALTLVVVAVALRRLYLYEEAFGWTRMRLWVHAFEMWLGLVVVLGGVGAVFGYRRSLLPRAVAGSGAAALLALAALNPDAFIAERNVDRFAATGKIDVLYLGNLSADAVPALDRLPEPLRSCALRQVAGDLAEDEPATAANLSRARARDLLDRSPVVRDANDPVICYRLSTPDNLTRTPAPGD
ncbi:DUF4153 domain-containing protein [Actinomadura sp. WAC 06369]|uniref:DUF4153 domain-containing protein n=1 Tax=Actinomadura sp. WAC 06369 TaxID=2203193 RepID=UPI000F792881|nr:DUF4173 domain-containing protein [Actinomadura sp. WAC 06369]RSN53387.1 DUF4173 domain-containing protein [Actinomadura sp. WAC 06369]